MSELQRVGDHDGFNTNGPHTWVPETTICVQCPHPFGHHKYLYSLGMRDFFRCERRGCECGEQYKPMAVLLPENTTEKQAVRIMAEMARIDDARRGFGEEVKNPMSSPTMWRDRKSGGRRKR